MEATSTAPIPTEIQHELVSYAEPIFHIGPPTGGFTVTNSLFTSWIVFIIIVIISIAIRLKLTSIPRGIQNLFEMFYEGAESLADQVTGSRAITEKALPIVLTVFIVILLNNWIGILPLGGLGLIETTEHGKFFIPFIRSGTADINGTLALSLLSVIGSNIFGIMSIGLWKTLNKYVNLQELGGIVTKIQKDPMIIVTAPIMFVVGLLEIIGEIAKVASLSFRLFGNVFAGEVLLAAMASIFAYILPLPFLLFEVFVGVMQAFIFSILTLVYYTISSQDHSHDESHEEGHNSTSSDTHEVELEKAH
jgi:F-type H+-transporting ATPase subunit a